MLWLVSILYLSVVFLAALMIGVIVERLAGESDG